MSAIVPFLFPETGQQIRVVGDIDAPLFHHADICRALQHTNPTVAARMLDDEDSVMIDLRDENAGQTALNSKFTSPGTGNATARFVTEPGMYTLALASKAPKAKAFRRWITHEVIPSIRRTGQFALPVQPPDELEMAERIVELIKARREETARRELAEAKVAELAPAARSWDVLASAHGDFAVAEAANMLARDPKISTGRDRLFGKLDELGWVFRYRGNGKWHPYQSAIEAGRLTSRAQSYEDSRTGERVVDAPQVRVTVKGVHDLHRRLGGVGPIDQYIAEVLAESDPVQGQISMLDVAS